MKFRNIFSVVALSLMMGATCHADVKYTRAMKMGDGKTPLNSTTTYIKDGAERVETVMQAGTFKINDVTLTVCAKKQTFHLDPDLKIYTAAPIGGNATATSADSDEKSSAPKKTTTGKITTTVGVKSLGEETVAGYKCRRYLIDNHMKMEGCIGNSETRSKMEIWVTDYKLPTFDCRKNVGWDNTPLRTNGGNCKVAYEQKGDVQAMAAAYRGLVVRMRIMVDGGKAESTMTQEITSISEAKLSDALFVVPADYRLVSDKEFQEMRSQAIMKAMTSGTSSDDEPVSTPPKEAGTGTMNDDADEASDGPTMNDDENLQQEEPPVVQEQPKKKKRLPFGLPF